MLSPCRTICSPPGSPSVRTRPLGENAARKPLGCSSASGDAVMPLAASRAASTPFCAARPAWKGLVMLPKFATSPPAMEAAMASAFAVSSTFIFEMREAAAAAAMVPNTAVGCHPLP
jgi:hypothetical protein